MIARDAFGAFLELCGMTFRKEHCEMFLPEAPPALSDGGALTFRPEVFAQYDHPEAGWAGCGSLVAPKSADLAPKVPVMLATRTQPQGSLPGNLADRFGTALSLTPSCNLRIWDDWHLTAHCWTWRQVANWRGSYFFWSAPKKLITHHKIFRSQPGSFCCWLVSFLLHKKLCFFGQDLERRPAPESPGPTLALPRWSGILEASDVGDPLYHLILRVETQRVRSGKLHIFLGQLSLRRKTCAARSLNSTFCLRCL